MKFTVIGHWGGYPKAGEASSGYILEHDGFQLLIDCGSAVLSQMQSIIQPEELNGVILSHYHPDHTADIGVLQHARLIQGFLGKEMDCLPIYGHSEDEREFSKLTYKNITKGIAYDPDQALSIGPFRVQFLQTGHPVPCYAMRFEAGGKSIVYTADTSFKDEFIPFSKGVDLLVCECNFYGNQNGKNAGHMTSLDAGNLANDANARQLLLTHLPHYGNLEQLKEEAATRYNGPISLAAYQWSLAL
ncbi:MBL fold metallo-hydrolase [Bacillus sp. DTU_2020_1000418_1_SI_GHA_SEK_038]|uniref:MBL fold metallo-hydrolase n=1 Tax=Bacillus sp. DTU_2020_1000418_1_SI_GHA_SEK_038 TaxID=3077585 RepID=UPI0028E7B035|nr:MBL fold metallo-hydrolase [Bacillus sp. DTU_2020_1000418_1_SI_GHA_SEK_038]WNS76783.1 MBL fold metallo-hydrolase [Bacillus sp. DTU_2020_1000418_1_SI_GHA_SEK_038]